MPEPEKTVFISYRRSVAAFIARAVFMDLRDHGYDVFMDVESIDSGQFESIILNQIAARAHFIIILTPGSLERCVEPGDWLRREIEHAMSLQRNIVPVLAEGFNFSAYRDFLTGQLADLPRYNALAIPHEFFEPAMDRLRTRFLKQPARGAIQPVPPAEQVIVERKIDRAREEAEQATSQDPRQAILADYTELIRLDPNNARVYVDRGLMLKELGYLDRALSDYNRALELDPAYVTAYNNRGSVYHALGEYDLAFADYSKALELNPEFAAGYHNRALVWMIRGDQGLALQDYNRALELDPAYVDAYLNRAQLFATQGDTERAIADFTRALEIDPQRAAGYNNRGNVYYRLRDYDRALQDYNRAVEVAPNHPHAYNNRANIYYIRGDYERALKDYDHAVALDPNYREAIEGRARTRKALIKSG